MEGSTCLYFIPENVTKNAGKSAISRHATKRSHCEFVCRVVTPFEYQLNYLSIACVLRFFGYCRDVLLEVECNSMQTTQETHSMWVAL